MTIEQTETDLLKNILENLHQPEALDGHPWASSRFVREMVERQPPLAKASPGRQLALALSEIFAETRPSTPPRRGKRLDTRWGEFGLLAALYFAPLRFGTPAPTSLRDAWGRIDYSILLYVDGHDAGADPDGQLEKYGLVTPELEVAPISTLSDWHRKGIQRLGEAVLARERYLEGVPAQGSPAEYLAGVPRLNNDRAIQRRRSRRGLWISLALVTLVLLGLGGIKARQVYTLALPVRDDLSRLRGLAGSSMSLETVAQAGPLLAKSRGDLAALHKEMEPFLWLGPWLGWVPVYGGDLASSAELLQMGSLLLESADTAVSASTPLLEMLARDTNLDPSQVVLALGGAQPELGKAKDLLDRAMLLRSGLDAARLSPRVRSLLEDDLDRLLPVMDEGLTVATALPHLLGAASEGPRTYLLLAQNEDELRPTGGFITAAGTLVVQNGEVVSLSFVDSGELDNWEKPYPQAPWQLEQYMNSPVLVLRDSNWFPDFPTSALYAETLYAYTNSHSVDGVIAFDQHMVMLLLQALGPLKMEGSTTSIDAQNVIDYMRAAKLPPSDQLAAAGWTRKGFMDKIARAMFTRIFDGRDVSWKSLAASVSQGLSERHLLLQLDDPALATLVARHGWDGAMRYDGAGDYLRVVDSNVGFNKTNAVVETSLAYDIDLTEPEYPLGTLTVTHKNNAPAGIACIHWGALRPPEQKEYPIDACYWDYMRIYVPAEAKLLDATRQSVPAAWMILGQGLYAPVDVLDEELDGLQGFGSLLVVPGGMSRTSEFQFRLAEDVVSREGNLMIYRLRVAKQPGTIAVPLALHLTLPDGAVVQSAVPEAAIEGDRVLLELDLRTDLDLEVKFLLK